MLAYDDTGRGPLLVLVHGITESRRVWDPLIAPFASDHRVVAVDLRGHGASPRRPPYDALTMAGDLHDVVRAAGQEPLVVGHSLGGAVVSAYAARYPVRAVVNVDQPLDFAGFKSLLATIEPLLRGDEETFRTLMAQIFDAFYPPLPDEERARITSHPEQDVVLGVWDTILASTVDELAALVDGIAQNIDAPYLSLHGSDPGASYTTWLESTIAHGSVEVWPDHGHYPHLVEPERFVERVRTFESSC